MNANDLFNNTLFINLQHRTDRLNHVQTELSKLNIIPTRFNAVNHPCGAIGCTLSHIECLRIAKKNNWSHVFIVEDDICFSNPQLLVQNINKFLELKKNNWDVLLVAGNNRQPFTNISDYCIKVSHCVTTTGYIVQQHYYDTIINNFVNSVQQLIAYPTSISNFACDVYWLKMQRANNWYLIIPLTVYQLEGYSDIECKNVEYKDLMTTLNKPNLYNPTNTQVV